MRYFKYAAYSVLLTYAFCLFTGLFFSASPRGMSCCAVVENTHCGSQTDGAVVDANLCSSETLNFSIDSQLQASDFSATFSALSYIVPEFKLNLHSNLYNSQALYRGPPFYRQAFSSHAPPLS